MSDYTVTEDSVSQCVEISIITWCCDDNIVHSQVLTGLAHHTQPAPEQSESSEQ